MGGAAQAVIGYGRAMTEGWSEYFFMIGSSAAALIGLMFVVVVLFFPRGLLGFFQRSRA